MGTLERFNTCRALSGNKGSSKQIINHPERLLIHETPMQADMQLHLFLVGFCKDWIPGRNKDRGKWNKCCDVTSLSSYQPALSRLLDFLLIAPISDLNSMISAGYRLKSNL